MKIGIDGSRAFIKNRTGVEEYTWQILKHLAKIKANVDFLIYLRPDNQINPGDWPNNFRFKNINMMHLWTQIGLAKELYKDELDVLFVPGHTIPLIKPAGLKTVMTVHDLGSEYLPSKHQLKQRLYLKWITKYQLRTTTRLIAVSKATKNDLISKAGCKPEQIHVIYEGIDLSEYKKPKYDIDRNLLRRFDLHGRKFFLFVGTIQPRKNFVRLIKAFSHLTTLSKYDEYDLLLAGGKGWLSEDIYSLPSKLGIPDRVKFLGYVSTEEKLSLYSYAAALVFPSLFEGFGLPVLEAYSMDCPVVTSNSSSLPEAAGKGAILVDPYDIDSIKKGMVQILDSETQKALRPYGKTQLQIFSWEKAAKETLSLLIEVANEG